MLLNLIVLNIFSFIVKIINRGDFMNVLHRGDFMNIKTFLNFH